MRLIPTLALLAACTPDCPPGSARAADGLCTLSAVADSGGAEPEGTDGSSDGADGTDAPIEWQTLDATCDAPGDLGRNPVSLTGEVDLQRSAFIELVDLAIDPDRGLAFGAGQGGFVVADISDPAAPVFQSAGSPRDFFLRFYRVAIGASRIVYTTHRDYGLVAWDTSNPESPRVTHALNARDLSGMAVAGDHLYVVTHGGELVTFDASSPDLPVEVARTGGLANAWQPLAAGDRLYVADNTAGVVVFDRSDPAAPAHVATVEAQGGVQELAISDDGSTLYAAVGGAGVEVFSLADPDAPVSTGLIDLHYSVLSIDTDGDVLWAANQQDVAAIDISRPRSPAPLGTKETRQWAMHVAAAGGQAWVGDWGWLASYAVDADAVEPDVDPASTSLYLAEEGGEIELSIANLGAGELNLLGATSDDDRVTLAVSDAVVAPGESALLRVTYSGGGGLDAELCLSTNDPDEPLQTLSVVDGGDVSSGAYLGTAARDFEVGGLDGQRYRLSEQLGHPVVLVYFATW